MKNLYSLRKYQRKIGNRNIGHYIAECYELYEVRINNVWKRYLVYVRYNEGKEHAFLCRFVESLMSKNGLKAKKINATTGPDLEFEFRGKKICFEIKTGKRLDRMPRTEMYFRFLDRAKEFDQVFIIVPNERVARRYKGLGQIVVTLARLEGCIEALIGTQYTRGAQNARSIVHGTLERAI